MDIVKLSENFQSITELLKHPNSIYSLITIAFYLILRIFGIDIIPLLLKKFGYYSTNNADVDINGNYIYQSVCMDSTSTELGYNHGGYVKIEQTVTPFGIQFVLSGFRTWRKFKNKPKEEIDFHVSSDWGGVFDGKKIKYTYSIVTPECAKIVGFIQGDIQCDKDGRAQQIICTFSQLPPSPQMYGTTIIKRIDKETVGKSDVYELIPTKH